MWELDYKESWAPKNCCFWAVVLEKTLESPLDSKEIQPVHPKGNQSWILIGRTDAEAETPILWPPDAKNWLIGKDPDAGKDWRQEEKGMTEDEIVGWHYWLNRHEFEQVLGVGDGQGSLACCSPWGCKESDMTEQLKWTELMTSKFDFYPPFCLLLPLFKLHIGFLCVLLIFQAFIHIFTLYFPSVLQIDFFMTELPFYSLCFAIQPVANTTLRT